MNGFPPPPSTLAPAAAAIESLSGVLCISKSSNENDRIAW